MNRFNLSAMLAGGFIILLPVLAAAQAPESRIVHRTLLGNSGMVFTPTAEIAKDREFSFGFSYIPEKFSQLDSNRYETGDKVWYANFGFLPFLELTVGVSKPSGSKSFHGIGDRSIFLRFNLLREKGWRPAVTAGFHDPFGNGNYHTTYLVASKHFSLSPDLVLLANAGFGGEIQDSWGTYLIGPFGGVSATWKFLTFELEHDTEKFNSALKASLLRNHLTLNLALIGMEAFTGGVSTRFRF